MSTRVEEILSWYGSDNPGPDQPFPPDEHGRLAGTGKFVILPVDQGFEHGPARSFAPNPPLSTPATISSSPSTRAATPMQRLWASLRPVPGVCGQIR